tara:strand:+ start:275 stop:427 length:153 start_codon:yes stop_codon:yes gene_type:complete
MGSSLDNSKEDFMDLRVKLPIRLISKVEELRKEWGLNSRSDVIEKLIEGI